MKTAKIERKIGNRFDKQTIKTYLTYIKGRKSEVGSRK